MGVGGGGGTGWWWWWKGGKQTNKQKSPLKPELGLEAITLRWVARSCLPRWTPRRDHGLGSCVVRRALVLPPRPTHLSRHYRKVRPDLMNTARHVHCDHMSAHYRKVNLDHAYILPLKKRGRGKGGVEVGEEVSLHCHLQQATVKSQFF